MKVPRKRTISLSITSFQKQGYQRNHKIKLIFIHRSLQPNVKCNAAFLKWYYCHLLRTSEYKYTEHRSVDHLAEDVGNY